MDELTLALVRFPLLSYVQSHAADQESRKEWMLDCPRCGKRKLTVNVEAGRWRCFTCEKYHQLRDQFGRPMLLEGGGGVFSLVQWLERCSPREAAQLVIKWAAGVPHGDHLEGLKEAHQAVQKMPTGLPHNAVDLDGTLPYMQRRGITLADFKQFGMRYVPPDGSWLAHRLVFPVWERGQCVYWQARACWDESEHRGPDKFRKTLNPSAERNGVWYFGSSDVVGNLEQAARYPRVAITEGPTSGIRTGPDAVWTFGKHMSPAQVGKLLQAGVRAVDFMWDGPSAKEPEGARPQMEQAAAMLRPHMDVRMVYLPKGDPGEYSREQLHWFRAQASNLPANSL